MATLLRRPWLFALLIGLLAAGVAGLVSAHNGDPTAIHACVNQAATPRGQVIIYSAPGLPGPDPTSVCGTRGTPVDWNAQGIPGPTGATGPAGSGVFGEIYTEGSLGIGPGFELLFVSNGPLQGVSKANATVQGNGLRVATAGTYRVDFTHTKPTADGPVAIRVNNVDVPGGRFDMFTTSNGAYSIMLPLAANDLVTVVYTGAGSPVFGTSNSGRVAVKLQATKLS